LAFVGAHFRLRRPRYSLLWSLMLVRAVHAADDRRQNVVSQLSRCATLAIWNVA
jgi:hypothetical protein